MTEPGQQLHKQFEDSLKLNSHAESVNHTLPTQNADTHGPLPFPQRSKQVQNDKYKGDIMEQFKKVQINIPLLEAIKQIPSYAKFLKDICTHKRRFEAHEKVMLSDNMSAVLQRKLPPKLQDHGSFTIPYIIGERKFDKALINLGANVNLMPYSVYEHLGLGELKHISISLLFADCSVKYPRGIVEDVLFHVDQFILPADFIILDMEETEISGRELLLILGRPFMATAGTKIDVKSGLLTMTVQDITANFQATILAAEEDLNAVTSYLPWSQPKFEILPSSHAKLIPSIVQPPKLELKPFPTTLKYVYLGDSETLLIIIAADLSQIEEEKLIRVLREYKQALGWSIANIKGISPLLCMHRIHLEDNSKPSREAQRRLNPNMKEVVCAEVLKLLDVGIIYPISNSKWVSTVQVVPEKFRITVVKNEHNELIPQRTVTGYNQIPIAPEDQDKTTFTCPFGNFAYRRMPFGLCNSPTTFQRCIIFSDIVERFIEVFMDDVSVFSSSFDQCLHHLSLVLQWCQETNLILNWEKCHFMVKRGIVLGHIISSQGIEVDRAKVELISKLPLLTSVKEVRSFLGHVAVETLKKELTQAPIVRASNWTLPFEIMCDASDYAIGAVLGQRVDKLPHVIYYATLRHLLTKKDAKPRLLRWILLLQEFDLDIKDKKGTENVVANHLSRLVQEGGDLPINESFLDEQIFSVEQLPWYADIGNYLAQKYIPKNWDKQQRKHFLSQMRHYYWDDPYLFKHCPDQIIRRCFAIQMLAVGILVPRRQL
ncbi:hypothetical protein L3X38_017649 [Prunus dulcis]|uniref:Transposable element protein n=1 Tax=Prunus dulcis TaxID=3755 RepID=A0AAD4ZAX3_PRUDU|nr:hypothetical protein L3X38_017649 [Prunus dulcis]